MEEYRPNSHKYREEQKQLPKKKVEKVVNHQGRTRKKNGIQKLADIFLSEDAVDVKSYVIFDVLIPTAKKTILDVVESFLYGEVNRSSKKGPASRVQYGRYYKSDRDRDTRRERKRSGYSYDEIVVDTRGEAEDILSRMDELIDVYGLVSVADLYDLAGVSSNFTDNKYGWTDIRKAEAIRVSDGYLIKLPRPLPLD